jgi:hypothetical protein
VSLTAVRDNVNPSADYLFPAFPIDESMQNKKKPRRFWQGSSLGEDGLRELPKALAFRPPKLHKQQFDLPLDDVWSEWRTAWAEGDFNPRVFYRRHLCHHQNAGELGFGRQRSEIGENTNTAFLDFVKGRERKLVEAR